MPHRGRYERILEKMMNWQELKQPVSRVLNGSKQHFWKQVVVAIDGKVLQGTLDEKQERVNQSTLTCSFSIRGQTTCQGVHHDIPGRLLKIMVPRIGMWGGYVAYVEMLL
jgi:hypothetical protein